MNNNDSLELQRFHFQIRFCGNGRISRNWGPTIRGGFGHALRKVSCSLNRDSCKECQLGMTCAYGYIFETPIAGNETVMRKYPQAPHPFIFEPPENMVAVKSDETACISLVIVGNGLRYLPYFLLAIEELGSRGLGRDKVRFQVDRITLENGECIYNRKKSANLDTPPCIAIPLTPGSKRLARIELAFDTPARIMREGRIAKEPTLVDIVKALGRRLFLLRHFHGNGNAEQVPAIFVQAAERAECVKQQFRWVDAMRHSNRQQRKVPIGGIVGSMTYDMDFGVLESLLRAGEYVHVGKNTTFGLGKYRLVEHGLSS